MWNRRSDYFSTEPSKRETSRDDDNKSGEKTRRRKNRDYSPEMEDTREFAVDSGSREPVEKCEQRGSVKDYSLPFVFWRVLKPLAILIVSVALIIILGISVFNYVKGNYFDPVSGETGLFKTIQIKAGSSLSSISNTLFDNGIIRNKFVFQIYVDFNDLGSKLKAGTYSLSPSMTIDQIISVLAAGSGSRQIIKVTLTEGMTVEDMAATLKSKGLLNEDGVKQFLDICREPDAFSGYTFVKKVQNTTDPDKRRYVLEGYLFPDTYEFYKDATPTEVITKMLDRFKQIFTPDYEEKASAMGLTIDKTLTLASIIEWESLPQDYGKVSAVFHNRLAEKWKLESEATLRYVLNKKPPYTEEERNTDSKYNTNVVAALPIGPICNPGKKAIEAALNPDNDYINQKYMFFCNQDLEGNLVFAKTLKEQNANIKKYNKLVAEAAASPTPNATASP